MTAQSGLQQHATFAERNCSPQGATRVQKNLKHIQGGAAALSAFEISAARSSWMAGACVQHLGRDQFAFSLSCRYQFAFSPSCDVDLEFASSQ
jgi:hypothetical protein